MQVNIKTLKQNIVVLICMGFLLIMVSSCATVRSVKKSRDSEKGKDESLLKLTIANVSLNKKTFTPLLGETVKVRFRLSKEADISIKIYNSQDELVNTLCLEQPARLGYNEIQWDGKDDLGNFLPSGGYVYVILAEDKLTGETIACDKTDTTGGEEITVRELSFDSKTGKIEYVLPKAARVRIRVGLKNNGPLVKTIVDWKEQEAGRHTIDWDGDIDSEGGNLLGSKDVLVSVAAFALPENTIIVQGEENKFDYPSNDYRGKRFKQVTSRKKYLHALHSRSECHEPGFDFEILGAKEYKAGNVPVLEDDIIPLKIVLDDEDKTDLINSRFEIIFFVDYVFTYEEEEGISPCTYKFSTKGMNEGGHVITVNIHGFKDHIGTRSKRIFIRRK